MQVRIRVDVADYLIDMNQSITNDLVIVDFADSYVFSLLLYQCV